MKTTILSIAIATIFASCANDRSAEQAIVAPASVQSDTAGLAQFQQWKAAQEMINNDVAQSFTTEGIIEEEAEKPAPVIIYRDAPVRAVKTPKPTAPKPVSSGTATEPYNGGATGTGTSQGDGTTVSNGDVAVNQPAEVPAQKKGWSKAAKGAVIGGASGAVLGAVISKNKTKGAVIGGVVGAAGGYIFGRTKDKKDGR